MSEIIHWYLHVDLDAFFASVEQLDHPEYRGKPVIVGGKPEDRRSVVSTASYEARKFGVHSAMPTYQAYKLCPQGIYVHGRMQRYAELSYKIMNIFREYSPDVDQMSIDEAFIDLTGTERLFGPPTETAKRIKEHVKKDTGLTVSVGLASTKYLAKIASGFSKPDGFYHVHHGDEEKFMLELPLNKVWGLGPKSLELLKSKGINSTQDIYDKPIETLEFMFGKNMAAYLYSTVRGGESESFGKKAKSHSISAETTFPYDLTDVYTIETELLELCHGVFFRLLKENSFSRTAFVKIRYDDFTTCSIQETLDRNIMTLDSYYSIITRLFERKYEKGRGIRLLGVGLDHLEKEEKPYQQDLFANNDEKKQAVEKAILKLEKKHPEIKLQKARTLKDNKSLKALFLLLLLPFSASWKLNAKDKTVSQKGAAATNPDVFYVPELQEEPPESLFQWQIDDTNNVEFTINGFWKGEVAGAVTSTFGNDTDFTLAASTPVIKQEVEISAWIFLNKHWYFEVDFAEEFAKNTIAMGYISDDFVRSVRVANRGITIQNEYSADAFGFGLKSGNNQAPGASAHFQTSDNKLEADLLLRYDMTSTRSATFYGMNQVQDVKITPDSFIYGHSYNFPQDSITAEQFSQIKDIYVESKQGAYKDNFGRLYKKLSSSEYIFRPSTNTITLAYSAEAGKQDNVIPNVLVTFISSDSVQKVITQTGAYSDSNSFAGKIQTQFNNNSSGKFYNLQNYTPSLQCQINNENALIIQSSSGFTPYVSMNYYDCGLITEGDISVINNSSEITLTQFTAATESSSLSNFYEDYFVENHLYTCVSNKTKPDNIYPFADTNPEIYLNLPSNSDIRILVRTYTAVSDYQIGTEASEGTVLVYKNNTIDYTAQYNSNTGIVTLSAIPSPTDKIYITWQEECSDYSKGSLSAGAGLKYHFTPELTGDWAVTTSWPLAFTQTFSQVDDVHKGFAALSTGILYNTEHLSLSEKNAFAFQKDNASSALLVCAQSDNRSDTYYLEQSSGYETNVTPVLNTKASKQLNSNGNSRQGSLKGEKDTFITGYKIPLTWSFDNSDNWASVDIHLGAGNLLQNSSQLNIALLPQLLPEDADAYELYLQLGINASDTFNGEDPWNIPTWKIEGFDFSSNQWQTVSVYLEDTDRARLNSSYDARLIIVPSKNFNLEIHSGTGTIYAGPYEPVIQSLQPLYDEELIVTSSSYLYDVNDYSSTINWLIPSTTDVKDIKNTLITASTWFTAADFTNYNNITLDFALTGSEFIQTDIEQETPAFSLILDNGTSTALKVEIINIQNLINLETVYHTLNINLKENKVYIDETELNQNEYSLYINNSIIPVRQTVCININQNKAFLKQGSLYINKLLYTNTKFYYNLQNQVQASLQYNNFQANLTSKQNTGALDDINLSIITNGDAKLTLGAFDLSADGAVTNQTLTNSGHSIKTNKPVFNIFKEEESFRFNPYEQNLSKNNSLEMDFKEYNVPYSLKFNTKAQDQLNVRNQDCSIESTLSLNDGIKGINFETNCEVNQKINKLSTSYNIFDFDNYFLAWKDISLFEFSQGEEYAASRETDFNAKLEGLIPFYSFKPAITYGLTGNYKDSYECNFQDITSLGLTLPFTFSNNTIAFTLSRKGGAVNLINYGGTYKSDAQALLEQQKDRTWIYTSIPFYEMFKSDLKSSITADYSTKYEVNYKRKLFNSFKDVYIPSAASFGITRSIINQNTNSDIYQAKAVVTNTSINNFGSDSIKQIFKWFKQEEVISSITGIVKVPVDIPENTTYQITAYIQSVLMIEEKSSLTSAIDFSIEKDLDWSSHMTLIYARPGTSSFVTELINLLNQSEKPLVFNITRKDSFNIELILSDSIFKQKYNYMHSVDFNFLKYFTITTGLGTGFTNIQNSVSSISLDYSIGGKAEF